MKKIPIKYFALWTDSTQTHKNFLATPPGGMKKQNNTASLKWSHGRQERVPNHSFLGMAIGDRLFEKSIFLIDIYLVLNRSSEFDFFCFDKNYKIIYN